MSPDIEDDPHIFIRDTIRRSGRVGDPPLHPILEKYASIAIFGKCPLFPALSLFEGEICYGDACVVALRGIEMCESKTGLDRANLLRGLMCADFVPELARCKLERRKGGTSRITGGGSF